ncbi:MAG: homoserine dehydrogenase, partial [Dehalococcoidia bacterium]
VREVFADDSIQIIVELTGDARRGADYILEAIRRGKHVVTANNAAVVERWPEILRAAVEHRVCVGLEGTVGGGMPAVQVIGRHASNDDLQWFAGILNGTSNFILSRMSEEVAAGRRMSFDDAMEEARARGFAEPCPPEGTAFVDSDLSGTDTKYKVAILAGLGFRTSVSLDHIYCEGIADGRSASDDRIFPADLHWLQRKTNFELKLVGVGQRTEAGLLMRVHPALVDRDSQREMAAVREESNGLSFFGAWLGEQFLSGPGAGARPTAISVASDVYAIARGMEARGGMGVRGEPNVCAETEVPVTRLDTYRTRGFIRSFSPNVKGVLAAKLKAIEKFVSVNGAANIREFTENGMEADYIEIDSVEDADARKAVEALSRLTDVKFVRYLRVLDL